ncbi:deoxyribonuclease IV [Candidatus Dependentiae bacterium]|nr:deoxyribonuclease IV [Candidatus Dependentiae bacterium]
MKKEHRLLLGAHLSIADGFDDSIQQAMSLGCTTLQIFTKSNRQWHAKALEATEVKAFLAAQKQSSIAPVVAHASYLINIGSADQALRSKSIDALLLELERCSALSIAYLVLHPGSHTKTDEMLCLAIVADSINQVLARYTGNTMLLLESMAGQGSTICYTLEQLASILKKLTNKKRVGICIDTCHVFAAGYDISNFEGYQAFWQAYDNILGIGTLKAIHLNDSKKPCGSRVDRHEHIGQGMLGKETFKLIMNDSRFFDVPKILETPLDDRGDFASNLKTLKGLLSKETKTALNCS